MSKTVTVVTFSRFGEWTGLWQWVFLRRGTLGFRLWVAAAFLIALLISAGDVHADRYDVLRADQAIESGLLIIAIGDIVRDYCPSFEARRVRGVAFLNGLVNRARQLGYNLDEIRFYVENEEEKARVKARARQWLLQQEGDFERPETLCQIARNEIAKNTQIGRLIREK